MNRFDSLISELYRLFPDDWWLKEYQSFSNADFSIGLRTQISIYEDALCSLDENAWSMFKGKVTKLFKQNSSRRGKYQFFNQLNESFAYKYLKTRGCNNIMFLPERGSIGLKTSDLSFEENSAYGLCEVKTIGVSDEEIDRYEKGEVFSTIVYRELGEGFFNKLGSLIENALEKMQQPIEKKLIFFVVHFDDLSLSFFPAYEKEITRFVSSEYPSIEIYFQIGLNVEKKIYYTPQKLS